MKKEPQDKHTIFDTIKFQHEKIDTKIAYKEKYPLHYAVKNNNQLLVVLLLEESKSKKILFFADDKDSNGTTLIEYVQTEEMQKILERFKIVLSTN